MMANLWSVIFRCRVSRIPRQIAIGYETQQLSLRLAANYKSKYLAELGDVEDSRYDIYEDDNLTLDFSANG